MHGTSLIEHIVSGGVESLPERTAFWEFVGKVTARRGGWKIVGKVESTRGRWRRLAERLESTHLELHDLEEDIDESEDLREKRPREYENLKKELIAFFENIK